MPVSNPSAIKEIYIEGSKSSHPDNFEITVAGTLRKLVLLDLGPSLAKYSILPPLDSNLQLPEAKNEIAKHQLVLSPILP